MNHRIENGNLVITVTPEERAELCDLISEPGFDSDETMHDILEPLVTNDAFVWIDPAVTGDLTSAPMLAVLGDEQPGPDDADEALGSGLFPVGRWDHQGELRAACTSPCWNAMRSCPTKSPVPSVNSPNRDAASFKAVSNQNVEAK